MTKILKIEGMSCMHCAGAVTKALSAINGLSDAKVDLEGKTATVEISGIITDDILRAAVEEAGFELVGIKTRSN